MYLSIKRKKKGNYYILGKFGGGQPQPIDYSKEYFFIEDVSGEENVLTIMKPTSGTTYVNVSVSTDKVNWFDLGSTESGNLTYTIPANGKLYIKGVNDGWGGNITSDYVNHINCSKLFNVGGNIMSLLYGDDFIDKYGLKRSYSFTSLFIVSQVVSARNLILPATTLANKCYYDMFYGCTSLTEAPALPAMTLKTYCYYGMFAGCTSLQTSPALPATQLVSNCYYNMFKGCTNLNKIVTYANDITATNCLYSWLDSVSPTGDFYNLGGAEYPSGASGIPTGWTEHTSL